ncbi:MAG: hypothetical protein GXY32_07965 [Ruminococcaceae bacterium]|nr:hypothetical protein [Oscillospiraceae bacterium]
MDQAQTYPPQYRKLGGWLLFINVITILSIVFNGLSLLTYLVSLSQAINTRYPGDGELQASLKSFYFGTALRGTITAAVFLALAICVLVFLHRRRFKPFRVLFMATQGLYVAQYVVAIITSIINPVGQSLYNTYGLIFEDIFDSYPFSTSSSKFDLQAFSQSIEALFWVFLILATAVSIGLFIAWLFYFMRSKRVKVYFDPAYVNPPGWQDGQPIINPAAYYGTAWPSAYAQPYYGAGYPPAQPGYPAPYGTPYQQPVPPQAPVYPQPPPAATPAQAPLPHQEPPAQQQARQADPPT